MIPKVSILVPIYNVESFIERCAVSLFEQTFNDIEYIFVDDCTPDNSIKILQSVIKRYPSRVPNVYIIKHETNKGLAGARNTAIRYARGEYILQVDSDDYIDFETIELLYGCAKENDSDVVICDYILKWDNTSKFVEQQWSESNEDFIKKIISVEAMPCVWNKLFRRSLYIQNDICAIEGINFGEDLSVVPKLLYFSSKINKVDKNLIYYVQSNPNAYTKKYSAKNESDLVYVMNDLTHFFIENSDYDMFEQDLNKGKLRKKIELIFKTNFDKNSKTLKLFPEAKIDVSKLTIKERIIYILIDNNRYNLLKLYIYAYESLYNLIQLIKKRK